MYRRHFTTRFCKNVVVSKQLKNKVAVLAFFDLQKGSVTSTRIIEQPTLLTKSTINCPCCARLSKISSRSRGLRQIVDLRFHLLFNLRLKLYATSSVPLRNLYLEHKNHPCCYNLWIINYIWKKFKFLTRNCSSFFHDSPLIRNSCAT